MINILQGKSESSIKLQKNFMIFKVLNLSKFFFFSGTNIRDFFFKYWFQSDNVNPILGEKYIKAVAAHTARIKWVESLAVMSLIVSFDTRGIISALKD